MAGLSKAFVKIPKALRTLAEAMGYEPEAVARGLKEAHDNPLTRNFSVTLNQRDLPLNLAIKDQRTLDNAEFMRDNALAFSPHFRSWFGDSLITDPNFPVMYMKDGSRIARPEQLYHGSGVPNLQVLESGHGRQGDTGVWLSNSTNRGESYAVKGGEVIPLYARAENPVIIDNYGDRWNNIGHADVIRDAGLTPPDGLSAMFDDVVAEYPELYDMYRRADNKWFPLQRKYEAANERLIAMQNKLLHKDYVSQREWDTFNALDDEVQALRSAYKTEQRRANAIIENLALNQPTVFGYAAKNRLADTEVWRPSKVANEMSRTYEFTKALKAKHADTIDGVRMNNIQDGGYWGNHGDNVIVWNPNQIKSSSSNNGLFRLDDPRFAYGLLGGYTVEDSLAEAMNEAIGERYGNAQ